MKNLSVWLSAKRAGTLTQDDAGQMAFSYSADYLQDPNATPLSRRLPLREVGFSHKVTRSFFAGVLPEEDIRDGVARLLGISKENDFAMLERIGGECAGAVCLLPTDQSPLTFKTAQERRLSGEDLVRVIRELPGHPLLAGQTGIRLSLAGAQTKVPLIVKDDDYFLPLNDSPSTHILKPEPVRFPGLAANETFCMALAKAVGLRVAEIEYREMDGQRFVLVRRFDREFKNSGELIRLHQEDFCQALGFPPERKYQIEGGPNVKDCAKLIWEWSTYPALDLADFLQRLVFNTLIGNADAHGKNFSFLYTGSERRLTPAYDLVSTIAWPGIDQGAAMKVGGCDSINTFGIGDWKKLACQVDASWPLLSGWMMAIAEGVLEQVDGVATQLATTEKKVVDQLAECVKARSIKLLANMNSTAY